MTEPSEGSSMSSLDMRTVTSADGRDLLAAAQLDWSRPIPHCPGWDAADLVAHMGGILAWMAVIVSTGEAVSREDRERPPGDRSALPRWYTDHLVRTVDLLSSTAADTVVWTFSSRGEWSVGWWRRRLAVELAIHRWDAQHAASVGEVVALRPLDATVAAAGIDEFVTEFLPGLLARPEAEGLSGTLRLCASDGPGCWSVDLDGGTVIAAEPDRADTVVAGTQSDLLLWLTNRAPTPSVSVLGDPGVGTGWRRLRR